MFNVGDRVYYIDNGRDDTGTVCCIQRGVTVLFGVDWDHNDEDDVYMASQLALC